MTYLRLHNNSMVELELKLVYLAPKRNSFNHHHFVMCWPSYTNIHTQSRKYQLEDISHICWSYSQSPSFSHTPFLSPSLLFTCSVFFFFFGQLFKQVRKSYDGNGDPGYPFSSYYSSKLVNSPSARLSLYISKVTWHTISSK